MKVIKMIYIEYCKIPERYLIDPFTLAVTFLIMDNAWASPLATSVLYACLTIIVRVPYYFLLLNEPKI
jgi:hypothetical protein